MRRTLNQLSKFSSNLLTLKAVKPLKKSSVADFSAEEKFTLQPTIKLLLICETILPDILLRIHWSYAFPVFKNYQISSCGKFKFCIWLKTRHIMFNMFLRYWLKISSLWPLPLYYIFSFCHTMDPS